jgi:hypothetical protein
MILSIMTQGLQNPPLCSSTTSRKRSGKEEREWSWNSWWPPWRRRNGAKNGESGAKEGESGGESPTAILVNSGENTEEEEEEDYIIPSPLPLGENSGQG